MVKTHSPEPVREVAEGQLIAARQSAEGPEAKNSPNKKKETVDLWQGGEHRENHSKVSLGMLGKVK